MAAPGDASRVFRLRVFHIKDRRNNGLGNACLLELPDGTFGVVDWGTQNPDAFERFFDIVRRPLTFVAATHAHADHTLGMPTLLDKCAERGIRVHRVFYPASSINKEQADLTRTRLRAHRLGITTSQIHVNDVEGPNGLLPPPYLASGDGWDVRVLSPPSSSVSNAEEAALGARVVAGNKTSLVILLRFTSGGGRGLLTGDATVRTLQFAARVAAAFPDLALRNDCFVVPHHGARNGVPRWLLELCNGALVVSAPTDTEEHPSPATLEAMADHSLATGSEIFCTSYAHACQHRYGVGAPPSHAHLVQPGECFGDVVIDLCEAGPSPWKFVAATNDGNSRRIYGYCGSGQGRGESAPSSSA